MLRFPAKVEGKWAHIAVTFNHSSRIMKAFYDGHFIGAVDIPLAVGNYTAQMALSRIQFSGSASFDEFRFWSRELDGAEIGAELFTPQALPSPDILASFSFDNGMSA